MPFFSPPQNYPAQLVAVANYLNEQEPSILRTWRAAVNHDEQLTIASSLSQEEFEGQIPALLQFLNREICSERVLQQSTPTAQTSIGDSAQGVFREANTALSKTALTKQDHGAARQYAAHRWRHGYDIGQLLLEWGHLNLTLVQTLNDYEALAHSRQREQDEPEAAESAIAATRLLASQLCDAGYFQSVTEFHRLQQTQFNEMIQNASDALEHAVQWEKTRGQVLREAVHDLRGNLTVVQGAASLLTSDLLTSDPMTESSASETQDSVFVLLRRGTQILYQMMTDLLDLSRLEAGHENLRIEPFDAALLVRELCQHIEPLTQEKGLALSCTGPSTLAVEGDALKVRRIAQNLLLNALKYTSEGSVTVQYSEWEQDQWRFSIEDTGPGLVSSPQARGGTDASKGEGVGLAIVRRLCALLKAQLEVETVPEQGTTFQVFWPRHYPEPDHTTPALPES